MNKTHKNSVETGLEIAVIGMAGKFPGAQNLEEFWENLKNGKESIPAFTAEELRLCGVSDDVLAHPGYVRAYGILEGKAYFDSSFFGYSPREAETMDPLIRLFHECSWEALEDSGYDPLSYKGTIGMYAGSSDGLGWQIAMKLKSMMDRDQDNALHMTENSLLISTRISHKLNLLGPSITMFTACSTSLVAIHIASRALLTGECNIALAGAGSVMAAEKAGYMYEEGMIMSPDGHCRPFDAKAGGTVYGEGVGIVVLKRLKQAIADGDTIKAVIKASAINNDGSGKASFTAPGKKRIADVIRTALKLSRVEPGDVSYVETHGTATALGDAIEIEALKEAFETDKKAYCALGAVKSNIGHLDVAAGMAGFIKTIQAICHQTLPPTLHFQSPNPTIDFIDSPFYINNTLTPWETNQPIKAGVCSFGMGGTNAFLILEPPQPTPEATDTKTHQLIILSARTNMALEKMTHNLVEFLKKNPRANLADVANTLQIGRREFSRRKMLVSETVRETIDILTTPTSENSYSALFSGKPKDTEETAELLNSLKTARQTNQIDRIKPLLLEIGHAWLKGATVDWTQLYINGTNPGQTANPHPKPKRIPLPAYPFERQYYWVQTPGMEQLLGTQTPLYIMVVGEPGVENKIQDHWQQKGGQMILVKAQKDAQFSQTGKTEFQFDPLQDNQYDRLFREINQLANLSPETQTNANLIKDTNELTNKENETQTSGLYQRPALSTEYKAPTGEVEKGLAAVWQKFFGIKNIGIDDDFFELGGDSLKAITVVTEIHKTMETRVPVTEIFQSPTIKKMAQFIKGTGKTQYSGIAPVEKKEYYPLSSVQKRIYILQQVELESTGYNTPLIFDVDGQLNPQQLETAFKTLLNRHESLRTSFQWIRGETVQRIEEKPHTEIQWYHPPLEQNPQETISSIIKNFIRPFDLTQSPLVRVGVIDCGKKTGTQSIYILMLDMHHIVTDGSSIGLLVREFMTLYSGGTLPPLPIQYKDYTQWQNSKQQREIMKQQEAFWVNQFSGEIPMLNLPVDFPRPAIQSFTGNTIIFEIRGLEVQQLKQIASEEDATLFMALLTLFNVLLARISNQEDIVVGSPLAGRTHADLQHVIGMLVNTLALRNFPKGNKNVRQFLREVRQNTLTAFENQDYLFEDLVDHVGLSVNRDVSRNPIFDVMFGMQNFRSQYEAELDIEIPGLNMKVRNQERGVSIFDLSIQGAEIPEGFWFTWEYSTKLFKRETIEKYIGYFRRIIAEAAADPDRKLETIEIISQEERQLLLREFNGEHWEGELPASIQDTFIQQANKQPDTTALVMADQHISYNDLNIRSTIQAHVLMEKGAGPHRFIAIIMERSVELITGILAVIKTGSAYIPIDPNYPNERREYMLLDSKATLCLTRLENQDSCMSKEYYNNPGKTPDHLCRPQSHANALVYIMYTSGSTGKPKGVMLEQRNLINLLWYQYNRTTIQFNRVLQFTTISFDVSFQEIFSTLLAGGTLFLVTRETTTNIPLLFQEIIRNHIKTLFFPASVLKFIFNEHEYTRLFPHCVTHIVTAGEQVVVSESFRNYLHSNHVCLHNHYGPTETHVVTTATFTPQEEIPMLPSIGKPVANTSIYIVTQGMQIQPIGIAGEMLIDGAQVGRGYLNNPELTADKFCLRRPGGSFRENHPLDPRKSVLINHSTIQPLNHSTLYRTGDLAQWKPEGTIEFLGRLDQQVKIRGYRIEPAEIEATLMNQPEIKAAVVVTDTDSMGEKHLCAYIVPQSKKTINVKALRETLSEILPEYMVPSNCIQIDEIPLTPNGKVDKKMLPEPHIEAEKKRTPPQNQMEFKLLEIWAHVLNLPEEVIGIETDFFQLGGHSLKAAVLTARIHKHFDVEVTLGEMFRHTTISELAKYITNAEQRKYTTIEPSEKKEYFPASSAQKRLYILQQLEIKSTVYNMPQAMNISGTVEIGKIEKIFNNLVKRHETFRTSFITLEDQPVQRIHEEVKFEIENPSVTLDGEVPSPDSFIRPFDLSQAPLIRVTLAQLDEDNHLLFLDKHHICFDGISVHILTQEFMRLFQGETLPELRLQYKDYAKWQNNERQTWKNKLREEFWLNQFSGDIPELNLPIDNPRPVVQDFSGSNFTFEIDKNQTQILNQIAINHELTLFMVLVTLFNITLSKLSGQEDIIIGTPTAGRNHADLEPVIGMFVNTLALRNYPQGQKTITDFFREVKERTLLAFENQEYQFEDLVEHLNLRRDTGRNPLFDIMLGLQNMEEQPGEQLSQENQRHVSGINYDIGVSRFDMTWNAVEGEGKLLFTVEYSTKLYKRTTMERYVQCFKRVISAVVTEPEKDMINGMDTPLSAIPFIPEDEKQQLLVEFNSTEMVYPTEKLLHQLFETQGEQTPDAIALCEQESANKPSTRSCISVSYHQLNHQANQLASHLLKKGLGTRGNNLVGLKSNRSLELIIAMLGILKAGGAYVPLNPKAPDTRNHYILAECQISLLISDVSTKHTTNTNNQTWEELTIKDLYKTDVTAANPSITCTPSQFCYVIYTSGSTGKPKGVAITHANLCQLLHWGYHHLKMNPRDKVIQNLAYFFDWSVWEIFITLTTGATLYFAPETILLNPAANIDFMTIHCITAIHATPTQFGYISAEQKELKMLNYLCLGAEAIPNAMLPPVRRLLNPKCRIFNMYGPTEATILAGVMDIPREDQNRYTNLPIAPIGKPVGNTFLLILDKYMQICPVGVVGELFIGGDGVAKGYLNNPEMTADKFCLRRPGGSFQKNHPLNPHKNVLINHSTLYRSGDLVRWLEDGNAEYLSRSDDQVKIRGHRIELGEIREHVLKHPEVKDAVVVVKENTTGDKCICAYMVMETIPKEAPNPSPDTLTEKMRLFLEQSLPGYMIPGFCMELEKIPLTPNGKFDGKALPAPSVNEAVKTFSPKDRLEEYLVTLWSETLGIDQSKIGLESNFFTLGGHSLKAVGLVSKLHKELNVLLTLAEILKNPTLRSMIKILKNREQETFVPMEPLEKRDYYPLSSAQKRLFLLQQFSPESTVYNIPQAVPLQGNPLDSNEVEKLELLFKNLIRRHESFRTYFDTADEEPVQRIHENNAPDIQATGLLKYSLKPESMSPHQEAKIIKEFIKPFDLKSAPLVRLGILPRKNNQYLLLVDMHHIIGDGTSISILTQEFLRMLRGEVLEELRIQYKDYTLWQKNPLLQQKIQTQEDYWLKEFNDEIPILNLPYDKSRPAEQDFKGNNYSFLIEEKYATAINNIAIQQGHTLFMVLEAMFTILLSKLSGQEDIVIGTPTAGRHHADLDKIIGMFVNTVALRNFPSGHKTLKDYLEEVGKRTLNAFANQEYQFEDLVEKAGAIRDSGRNPLFDVMMVLQNTENHPETVIQPEQETQGIEFSNGVSRFDMTWNIYERGKEILVDIEYSTRLFQKETMKRYANYFKHLVAQIPGHEDRKSNINLDTRISELELLPEEEKQLILKKFNQLETLYPKDETLQGLFANQVNLSPDQTALSNRYETHPQHNGLIKNNSYLTYSQLDRETQALALNLQNRGIGQTGNNLVGLKINRSIELIIAIIGILKAGGAYVPLNPKAPEARNLFILDECNVTHWLKRAKENKNRKNEPNSYRGIDIIELKTPKPNSTVQSFGKNTQSPDTPCYVIYTSGSTGKPKGVLINHSNLTPLLQWSYRNLGMNKNDRVIHNLAYYFDWSVYEIFLTLTTGATLCIVPEEILLNSETSIDNIIENQITALFITPSQYRYYLATGRKLSTLNYLCLGAEALSVDMAERSQASVPADCRIFNMYGPTETTIISGLLELQPSELQSFKHLSGIPIGKAVANTYVYVMDRHFNPSPLCVTGELYIGGDGVSVGYINNPELTAERFVQTQIFSNTHQYTLQALSNHSTTQPLNHSTMYRTGDLARWLTTGNLEYLGRIDHQVKVRGNRIELGEIESQIIQHPLIKEAVVVVKENPTKENIICAYIVINRTPNTVIDEVSLPGQLKEFLTSTLPEYMIPAFFVPLEQIPLNPNGKLDRNALPQPGVTVTPVYEPPADKIEEILAQIWADLLSLDKNRISRKSNFFQLGGHSLKGTTLLSRIHKKFGVKVPFNEVFKTPTIAGLAQFIKQAETTSESYSPLRPVEKREFYALSSAQKRLYVLQKLEPNLTVYNIPQVIPIDYTPGNDTQIEQLEQVFSQLIQRHESFRTYFKTIGDEPVQCIVDNLTAQQSPVENPKPETPPPQNSQSITQAIRDFIRPFDLTQAPLLRIGLLRVNQTECLLLIDIHHIIGDGASLSILSREFTQLSQGETLPQLPIRYRDYAYRQNSPETILKTKNSEEFWKRQFAGEIPVLNLPYDIPRPNLQSFVGSNFSFELGKIVTQQLNQLAVNREVTLFMLLIALYTILLSKLTGQEDIVIGTPIAGRNHSDLENIIGMFVNTLALRNYPNGEKTLDRFISDVKTRTLDAFENQDYQFEELVERVVIRRDPSHSPIFDVMLGLQNMENTQGQSSPPPVNATDYAYDLGVSRFDMTWNAVEKNENLVFYVEYSTKLFKRETVEQFTQCFKQLVAEIAGKALRDENYLLKTQVAHLEIVSPEDKQQLLFEFNPSPTEYPNETSIHELFNHQAEQNQGQIALVNHDGNSHISFHQLNGTSQALARRLIQQGTGTGSIVGIMAERSIELISGIIGILYAGGTYLPLDPGNPPERIDIQLRDSAATVVVSDRNPLGTGHCPVPVLDFSQTGFNHSNVHKNDPKQKIQPPQIKQHQPTNLCPAYVIYTSGSTGKPKGVMVEHKNVLRLVKNSNYIQYTPAERILPTGAISFDITTFEIWAPLLNELTAVLVHKDIIINANKLKGLLNRYDISILHLTPQLFNQLSAHETNLFNRLKHFLIGGDSVQPSYINQLIKRNPQLNIIHMYGPTENTTFSTYFTPRKEYQYSIPIGNPISNSNAFICDPYGHLQPVGVIGELYVGGDGLARGYQNNTELTAAKFIYITFKTSHRSKSLRIYKTGDMARWLRDGNIEFFGRIDQQVKIRGYRIEIQEIEEQLLSLPYIEEAIVIARDNPQKEKFLCAYIVSKKEISVTELRDYLSQQLPEYMIPAYFISIKEIPLTANGKLDKYALPVPTVETQNQYEAPVGKIETELATIWSEILSVEQQLISRQTNFFELGGHSLNVARLAARIQTQYQTDLSFPDIFKTPTIKGLATLIALNIPNTYSLYSLEKKEYYDVSFNQKKVWTYQQNNLHSNAYNISTQLRLQHEVSIEAVKKSLLQLMTTHDGFRTHFREVMGRVVQIIEGEVEIPLEIIDLTTNPEMDKELETAKIFEDASRQPFDLTQAPLCKVILVKLETDEWNFIFIIHHIISDGWSHESLKKQFQDFYNRSYMGEEITGEPLQFQFKEYCAWQKGYIADAVIKEKVLRYWKPKFQLGFPEVQLPVEPGGNPNDRTGLTLCSVISNETKQALMQLAKTKQTSLFMILFSAFNLLLHRQSGQEDIVCRIPATGRDIAEFQSIMGYFVNSVILKNKIRENETYEEILRHTIKNTQEAYQYQWYPLEFVTEILGEPMPKLGVSFNMLIMRESEAGMDLNRLDTHYIEEFNEAKYPLSPRITIFRNGIEILWTAQKSLFKPATLEQMAQKYHEILEEIRS